MSASTPVIALLRSIVFDIAIAAVLSVAIQVGLRYQWPKLSKPIRQAIASICFLAIAYPLINADVRKTQMSVIKANQQSKK